MGKPWSQLQGRRTLRWTLKADGGGVSHFKMAPEGPRGPSSSVRLPSRVRRRVQGPSDWKEYQTEGWEAPGGAAACAQVSECTRPLGWEGGALLPAPPAAGVPRRDLGPGPPT